MTEDQLQKEATDRAAESVGEWLMSRIKRPDGSIDATFPVRAFTWTDLQAIAVAAVSGWTKARAEQAQRPSPQDSPLEYRA